MSRSTIRKILLMGLLAVAGLLAVQIFWTKQAFDKEAAALDERVNIALRTAGHRLLLYANDSVKQIPPIGHPAANSWTVDLQAPVVPFLADSLIKEELALQGIDNPFRFSLLDCATGAITFGSYNLAGASGAGMPTCQSRDFHESCSNIAFTLDDRTSTLVGGMGIWLFSSGALLVVLAFFTYTMISILKEKKLSEVKSDFINNMTHELKTPISTIAISSEALMDPKIAQSPERLQRYASIIYSENQRLKKQVEGVLRMAEIEKGELRLTLQEVDVHALLQKCVDTISLRVQKRNGQIQSLLHAAKHRVSADAMHLYNAFVNLVDNALKYSPENPDISIETENTPKGLRIAVSDKGIGMSPEHQAQVFKRFYRVPTGDRHDVKGFGIGLSYVKWTVEAHGGTINLESEPNKGSRFEIILPLERDD